MHSFLEQILRSMTEQYIKLYIEDNQYGSAIDTLLDIHVYPGEEEKSVDTYKIMYLLYGSRGSENIEEYRNARQEVRHTIIEVSKKKDPDEYKKYLEETKNLMTLREYIAKHPDKAVITKAFVLKIKAELERMPNPEDLN